MNKIVTCFVVALVLMGLTACTVASTEKMPELTAEEATPSPTIEPTPEPIVVFTDEVLEDLVRKAMNKPTEDITLAEAASITRLNLEMDGGAKVPRVKQINDLRQFPNLTNLNLNWAINNGDVSIDLSPIADLTKLEYLYLCCCGNVDDIAPLAGLTGLKDLWLWGNNISDISVLAGMTQLESLWIKGNHISDISVIANMKKLVYLYMEDNNVSDVHPLAGLTMLDSLLTSGNPITDFAPLEEIYPNLSEKDFTLE